MMNFDTILIDGSFMSRRLFPIHKELYHIVNGKKIFTGLAHGFLIGLANLKEQFGGKIVVCWDSGNKRRKKIDPCYKENRKKDWPDYELYLDHFKILKFFLSLTGIRQAKVKDEEGDDVIYTLSKRDDGKVLIVSNDHDLYQALSRNVRQLLLKRSETKIFSPKKLEEEMGLTPEQYGQAMTMSGCSGDNVPGVVGVGMKTAAQWIKKWPQLVPSLLGQGEVSLSEWVPSVDEKNIVLESTAFFQKGEVGPGKKLLKVLGNPDTVYKTWQLTQLYDVWSVKFFRGKYDEDWFLLNLERLGMHDCVSRIEVLRKLQK